LDVSAPFREAAATAACSFSVKAIDRAAAEFINANAKLAWVLTAQFLTAGSSLVPFFLLIGLTFHYVLTGEGRRASSRIIALVASVSVAILFVEFVKVTFARANVCE
jgi:sterol desaturase/sphingolipid hydroxylase (fatty acid hydroxylase superfamily)